MEQDELQRILDALRTVRCGAADPEDVLHGQIERALLAAGMAVQHEVSLAPRCRIDFLCGGVGIEIKKNRPQRAALTAQLERYAACPQIRELLVAAPRGVNLPGRIGGKRVTMLALERLWGICLP